MSNNRQATVNGFEHSVGIHLQATRSQHTMGIHSTVSSILSLPDCCRAASETTNTSRRVSIFSEHVDMATEYLVRTLLPPSPPKIPQSSTHNLQSHTSMQHTPLTRLPVKQTRVPACAEPPQRDIAKFLTSTYNRVVTVEHDLVKALFFVFPRRFCLLTLIGFDAGTTWHSIKGSQHLIKRLIRLQQFLRDLHTHLRSTQSVNVHFLNNIQHLLEGSIGKSLNGVVEIIETIAQSCQDVSGKGHKERFAAQQRAREDFGPKMTSIAEDCDHTKNTIEEMIYNLNGAQHQRTAKLIGKKIGRPGGGLRKIFRRL